MAKRKLELELTIDGKQANVTLNNADKLVSSLTRNTKTAGSALSNVGNIVTGLGTAFNMAERAFGVVADRIAETVELYKVQEQAEKSLEVALGYKSQALLDNASALQLLTVHGDEEIIQAQAMIAMFEKDEEKIKSLTKATLDLADAKGMTLASAADLVSKTIGSSTNAMSRYGIAVEGAVGSSERMESLIGSINEKFGGQAFAKATTETGKLEQAQNELGDSMERIGSVVVGVIGPLASTFATVTTSVVNAIIPVTDAIDTEARAVHSLTMKLTSSETTQEERIRIYGELKDINPSIVAGIDAENVSVKQLTTNLDTYNKTLVERILIEDQQVEIAAAGRKAADARIVLNNKLIWTEKELYRAEQNLYDEGRLEDAKKFQAIKLEDITIEEKLKKLWEENKLISTNSYVSTTAAITKAKEVLGIYEIELRTLTENKDILTITPEMEMDQLDEDLMLLDEKIKKATDAVTAVPIVKTIIDIPSVEDELTAVDGLISKTLVENFEVHYNAALGIQTNFYAAQEMMRQKKGFADAEYYDEEAARIQTRYAIAVDAGVSEVEAYSLMLEEKKLLDDDYEAFKLNLIQQGVGAAASAFGQMGQMAFNSAKKEQDAKANTLKKALEAEHIRQLANANTQEERTRLEKQYQKDKENIDKEANEKARSAASGWYTAQKAASAANATVKTYEAATVALASAPPPWNFALASAVTAAGLVNVASIISQDVPAFAEGVSNFSGGLALVGEQGPELVTLPNGSSVYTNSETKNLSRVIESNNLTTLIESNSGASANNNNNNNEVATLLREQNSIIMEQTSRLEAIERAFPYGQFDEGYTNYKTEQNEMGR